MDIDTVGQDRGTTIKDHLPLPGAVWCLYAIQSSSSTRPLAPLEAPQWASETHLRP